MPINFQPSAVFAGLALLAAAPALALEVTLAASDPSPRLVATQIVFTSTATDVQAGALEFRYRIRVGNQPFRTVQDFDQNRMFAWMPLDEGVYTIEVTARNRVTAEQKVHSLLYGIRTRIADGVTPVVTPTSHPLIFVYSAPPCSAGSAVRVRFRYGTERETVTPFKPCVVGASRNFLLAGMRPGQPYTAVHEVGTSEITAVSAGVTFTAGALPSSLPLPRLGWMRAPDAASCLQEGIILHANVGFLPGQTSMPVATDMFGRVVWYYPAYNSADQIGQGLLRLTPGGTVLLTPNDPASPLRWGQYLRETDLAGYTIRETTVARVSEQLVALGLDPITSFHHDAIRLPSGNLVALASTERVLHDVQGVSSVDMIGDMLIELDENLRVVWTWNAFQKLDPHRAATLGETCARGQAGCPPVTAPDGLANDWLHSNSIHYATADGNLLLSIRNQDWVIKIDYRNRQGTGDVLWRLGKDGDFSLSSTDPFPWFSHQHDANFDGSGSARISVYDNGNLRRATNPAANSRGQVFLLDEAARTAQLVLNADLGSYAPALGSAERLCNGNYSFGSGLLIPSLGADSVEVLPSGMINSVFTSTNPVYRSFRLASLYQP